MRSTVSKGTRLTLHRPAKNTVVVRPWFFSHNTHKATGTSENERSRTTPCENRAEAVARNIATHTKANEMGRRRLAYGPRTSRVCPVGLRRRLENSSQNDDRFSLSYGQAKRGNYRLFNEAHSRG